MSKLFKAFQRWKLSCTKPTEPRVTKIPAVYRSYTDCRLCVHLTKNEMKLDDYEIHYGTCNITGSSISNMGYPWQCHDFYTANMDD